MKNFGKTLLVIVLTLITAAAGVFGYFFFSGKDYYDFKGGENAPKVLTREEAKLLVEMVVSDLSGDNAGASSQGVLAIDYSNQYTDIEYDYGDVMDHYSEMYLQILKTCLQNEDFEENVLYSLDNSVEEELLLKLGAKLIPNGVEFYSTQEVVGQTDPDGGETTNGEKYHYSLRLIKNFEGENSWKMEYLTYQIDSAGETSLIMFEEIFAKPLGANGTRTAYRRMAKTWVIENYDGYNPLGFGIYDMNLETNKQLNLDLDYEKSSDADDISELKNQLFGVVEDFAIPTFEEEKELTEEEYNSMFAIN